MSDAPPGPPAASADFLDSWKEIAAYLGKDVRTAMRWEHSRGLPVHRLPGGPKASIYALRSELDRWRLSGPSPSDDEPRRAEPQEAEPRRSIAVLPFANLSSEKDNAYFCDGLADEIITALSHRKRLRVIARTSSFSFRGKEQDVRSIGPALGVNTLLEGSVRRVGAQVRVLAQLVDCSDGSHLWAEGFDCDLREPFAVQQAIASRIARALQVDAVPAPARPPVPEAYEAWLQGRYRQLNGRTLQDFAAAREHFAAAVALDPAFGPAHLSIGELHLQSAGFGLQPPHIAAPAVRAAVEKALEWDQHFGEAHAVLGMYRALFDFDWEGAEAAFARARECQPGSADVLREWSAWILTPTGRLDEAETAARAALALDPLSPVSHFILAQLLFCRRDYRRAETSIRTALDLGTTMPMLEWISGILSALDGRFDDAIRICEDAARRFGNAPMLASGLGMVYGWAGRREEARRVLGDLQRRAATGYVSPIHSAWVHIGLGEADEALTQLEAAVECHDPHVLHLLVKPHYDALRGETRFARLLARLHLPVAVSGQPA